MDDSLTLLIDGEVSELAPGSYYIGDARVLLKEHNELSVSVDETDTGLPYGAVTRIQISKTADDGTGRAEFSAVGTEFLHGLDLMMSTPAIGRY